MNSREQLCPVCGRQNECRVANGCAYKGPCWCEAFAIPAAVQHQLAEACPERACLCHDCLSRFNKASDESCEKPGDGLLSKSGE